MKIYNIFLRIRRFFNGFTRYKYPNDCLWAQTDTPVLGNKNSSFFDPYFTLLGTRRVVFVSSRKDNSIMRVFLDEKMEIVNAENVLSGFDSSLVNRPCVIRINDVTHMWFTLQKNATSCICHVFLDDNLNASLEDATIVISPTFAFEKASVMNPCVIFEEGIFKMWYACGEQYEPDYLAYAESVDGINWKKRNAPVLNKSKSGFDSFKVGGCDVKKYDSHYIMFYIGYKNVDLARICMAVSIDGINWKKSSRPLFSPVNKTWFSDSCYKPSFFYDVKNDTSYLLFNGRTDGTESVGFVSYKGDFLKISIENFGKNN